MQRGRMNKGCYLVLTIFVLLFLARGAQASGGSISGTISYGGSQTGAIYAAVFTTPISCSGPNGGDPYAVTQLSSLGSYTISNLPDGTYYLASVIITAGPEGDLQPTDPWAIYNGCGNISPVIISSGNAATGKDMTLVDGTEQSPNPFYDKYDARAFSVHGSGSYWVELYLDDPAHNAQSVSVSGPGLSGSQALTYFANQQTWMLNAGAAVVFGNTPPALPLTYTFSITDASGTTQREVVVQSYVDVFPTNLSPGGGQAVLSNPVFSWTGVQGDYVYDVVLYSPGTQAAATVIWDSGDLTTTSVEYDGPALTPGGMYTWAVSTIDMYGNRSYVSDTFSYMYVATGSISGTISYSGSQSNPIYIAVFDSPNIGPDSSPISVTQISSPGSYTISNLPDGTYYVGAMMTQNPGSVQMTDPYGMYGISTPQDSPQPVTITGGSSQTGIDFTIFDGTQQYPNPFYVPLTGSISGTISYSGSQTNPIYIGLFNNPNIGPDSSALYVTQIPSPGAYSFSNLPDGTYYVGAVMTQNIDAIQVTDPYGMYGIVNPGDSPVSVTISGGSAQSNIDFIIVDGTDQYPNPFAKTIAPTKIGVFDNGYWYLDSNMSWAWEGNPPDTLGVFGVGLTGAIPVVGDWNGDKTTKIGVYIDGTWYLDMNRNWQWDGEPTDKMLSFGAGLPDAIPVVGDWNGDGTTKIGIYSNGVWYLDVNGNGQWDGEPTDRIAYFGQGLAGAVPVVGDWNGNGTTKIGVYQNGYWYLDVNGNGQWDGEPTDQLGVFGVGLTNAVPVVGDWNADGTDEIGIYQEGLWYLDKNRSWQWEGEPTDQFGVFGVGLTGAIPVPGKW